MKKQYKHLVQLERDRIQALRNSGHKQNEIAAILKVDPSTISREIQRNRRKIRRKQGTINGSYEATVAERKAYVRRKYSKYQGKKINENDELKNYVIQGLENHWGPDEISGRMKDRCKSFYASKTAIYEWLYSVWGQKYCKFLYSERCKVKKRKTKKSKRTLIPHRIGIELRPEKINQRLEYGHYEGDTIVSGKKTTSKRSLAVIHERKAKYTKLRKINSLKPKLFNEAIEKMKDNLEVKSFTFDNGIENTKHEELKVDTYFCDPYSSWQKGGIENCNKMIRRYIPKGSDINDYSDEYVMMIENILNNKPRKSLGYKTPYEVMIENNLLVENKKTEVALRG